MQDDTIYSNQLKTFKRDKKQCMCSRKKAEKSQALYVRAFEEI